MTLTNTARSLLADAFVDALDSGTIAFHDAAHSVLCSVAFAATAFGAAANGVATLASTPRDGTVAAPGTIAHAHIVKSDATDMGIFTVGTSGAEINLSSLTVAANDVIRISAGTWTQPAS